MISKGCGLICDPNSQIRQVSATGFDRLPTGFDTRTTIPIGQGSMGKLNRDDLGMLCCAVCVAASFWALYTWQTAVVAGQETAEWYEGSCEITAGLLQEISGGSEGWDAYAVSFTTRLHHNRTDIESPLAVLANEWGNEDASVQWPGSETYDQTDEPGKNTGAETYRRSVIDCCTTPGSGAVWGYTDSTACSAASAPKCNASTLPEDYLFADGSAWKGVHRLVRCTKPSFSMQFFVLGGENCLFRGENCLFQGENGLFWSENWSVLMQLRLRAVPRMLQPDGLRARPQFIHRLHPNRPVPAPFNMYTQSFPHLQCDYGPKIVYTYDRIRYKRTPCYVLTETFDKYLLRRCHIYIYI